MSMKQWRFRFSSVVTILLIAIYFLLIPALAHVPIFESGGKSPETATSAASPDISKVLYGKITAGELIYYSFKMDKGERIVLGLTIPVEQGRQGFTPDLILMGPGLTNEGKVPTNLEVPKGYGVKVYSGNLSNGPEYEEFTPSAFYNLASLDLITPESGTYYVVVSSTKESGNYGIVIGYKEIFTLIEWISIPINQIKVYLWEGQSLVMILSPLVITLALGILALFFKRKDTSDFSPAKFSGVFAGLFFLGTGLSFLLQMLISLIKSAYTSTVSITLILALVSIILGLLTLRLCLKDKGHSARSTKKSLYFFIIGIAGLLLWAGWFAGPLLAFVAAVLRWKNKEIS
jgi:hypothetical protein